MATIERRWPLGYRVVLAAAVAVLLLGTAFYVMVLLPMYDEYDSVQATLETERGKIVASEWDSSESGLANAKKMYTLAIGDRKNPAAKAKSAALLEAMTTHLQNLIDDVKEVSRNPSITRDGKKTYSDKYDEVKKYLQSKDVELVPSVYGMGRISEGNYYNMTLKVLMTKEIVDLALKHRLTVARSSTASLPEQESIFVDLREQSEMKKVFPSMISTQSVRSYALTPNDDVYLLEIPLKLTVHGSLSNFSAFAGDLTKDGRNYALTNIEIQTEKPVQVNPRHARLINSQENGKRIRIENVTVTMVCTGFVCPEAGDVGGESGSRKRKQGGTTVVRPVETSVPRPMGI